VRVAVVHNLYQQPGGEDVVFGAEAALLEAHGHEVVRHVQDNKTIDARRPLALARATVWNGSSYAALRRLFAERAPRVAHFHNTFPLVSPAGYYAARREGVAVVQTLHNFRLACPNALFFRDQRVCEDCSGRSVPWPAVRHACYRGSRAASAATAAMLATHRAAGTYTRAVDMYVALTAFARDKFVANGIPAERIAVKPNFVSPDPGEGAHDGGFALYVGRLAPEKGVATLLDAWARLDGAVRLKVVGGGPLEAAAREPRAGVEYLGHRPKAEVLALMRRASFLVFPSEWYEAFPVTLVEAFATGLPVVASGQGSVAEIVEDGRTGRHFRAGDAADLAAHVAWAAANPGAVAAMGRAARATFEARYTAERNYEQLMAIYAAATGAPARARGTP
jgi:glycosyltransferase involved in cell wall biosynthesis